MNEITYNEPFPEVKLSACPHEIQNFRNSTADISIPRQFCTYLLFKGKKHENTFIITDANDCPNLLSHGTTFRMGVLLPNYPKSMLVEGENVPHFKKMSGDKMRAPTGPSNVFQILGDIRKLQQAVDQSENPVQSLSFRTTTPSKNTGQLMTTVTSTQENNFSKAIRAFPIKNTAQSGPPAPCAHVHKPPKQVLKPRDSVALHNIQTPHNGRTSVMRNPLMKQEILSHYFGCFEGIGQFSGKPYKLILKPEHRTARHAPRKVPVHLEESFKQEINSLVELGILEPVNQHTDWVNTYVIVEKDVPINSGNSHALNHSIKRKLRICLDPRDLNEALKREPTTHALWMKSLQNLKV